VLFRYNPVTKRLYRLITEQITVEYQKISAKSARKARYSPDRIGEERVKKLAVNFNKIAPEYEVITQTRSAVPQKTRYVIITTGSIKNNSGQLANFVSHKENRGFDVLVVTEDEWGGGTVNKAAENIRQWLKDNYMTERIEYVLLIGNPDPESGSVPMKMLYPRNNEPSYPEYKESPSDYYYADLTGNWDLDRDGKYGEWRDDFGPGGVDRHYEVVIGRIPFYGKIDDLDNILKKIIAYQNEKDESWRKNVLLAMTPSDRNTPGYPLGEAIRDNILKPKVLNYQQIYDKNCNEDNVIKTWKNSYFGAVFWWSHGTSTSAAGIISDPKTLDNDHPGFTFQSSCSNLYPEESDNLSYALLKNGAIAAVGATREVWYYPGQSNFFGSHTSAGMAFEYARYLIAENKPCGYALHEIKENINPVQTLWMNFTGFCLYGDPEIRLIRTTN